MTYFRTRPRRGNEFEPVLIRFLVRVRDDFDRIAISQLVPEGNDNTVDPCTCAMGTNLGMNGKCEIDRSRTGRKGLNIPLWSKDVDLVGEKVELNRVDEFGGIL